MLLPIETLFNASEVAQISTLLDSAEWVDGSQSAGGIAQTVKNNLQLNDQTAQAAELRGILLERLSRDALFISAALPTKIFPPKFNCYRDGGYYGSHVDSAIFTLANGEQLRSDLSATLFLSPPDSYEGGELCIETQYGAQEIKLNAGDLILYPSTSLHQVKAVTRGARVAAFFWVQSMVRSAFQREQLFELDQSVQQLTVERGAEDAEVRRLSAVYHNLLRHWAEV